MAGRGFREGRFSFSVRADVFHNRVRLDAHGVLSPSPQFRIQYSYLVQYGRRLVSAVSNKLGSFGIFIRGYLVVVSIFLGTHLSALYCRRGNFSPSRQAKAKFDFLPKVLAWAAQRQRSWRRPFTFQKLFSKMQNNAPLLAGDGVSPHEFSGRSAENSCEVQTPRLSHIGVLGGCWSASHAEGSWLRAALADDVRGGEGSSDGRSALDLSLDTKRTPTYLTGIGRERRRSLQGSPAIHGTRST